MKEWKTKRMCLNGDCLANRFPDGNECQRARAKSRVKLAFELNNGQLLLHVSNTVYVST